MNDFETVYAALNPQQRVAVDALEGPVLVLAGPGTGKTQILSLRIANLLRQVPGLEPRNILALTFTNAGAKNMQQRLVSLLGPAGYAVKCATFHSFCSDVIATHPDQFPVLTSLSDAAAEVDRYAIVETILRTSDFPLLKPLGDPFRYVSQVLNLIANYKREGHTVLTLRALAETERTAAASPELKKSEAAAREKVAAKNLEVIEVMAEYERLMRERGLYDYEDIILWVRDSFAQDEDLLRQYQEQYQYVLLDEFQDTNQAQLQVAQSLLGYWGQQANIFAVGDPNQSIYRFQGASLANTLSFLELYPEARVITLRTGYRCGQKIYDAAAALIKQNIQSLADDRLAGLADPLQSAAAAPGQLITYAAADTLAECFWVVDQIRSLADQGTPLDQIAVLYRQHKHSRLLANVLTKAGIAYEINNSTSILEHPFITQIIALLRFLVQLQENSEAPAVLPVLQQPWFKLNPTDILKLIRAARTASTGKSPWDILTDEAAARALHLSDPSALLAWREQMIAWQHRSGQKPVGELIESVLREAGIFALALAKEIPLVDLNVLVSFLHEAQEWSRLNPAGRLNDWLDRLDRMRRHGLGVAAKDLDLPQQAVRLSTAHQAKGQEWDYVFILHAQDTYWGNLRHSSVLKPLPHTVPYDELDQNEHNEDERRLFYVALTRARQQVGVSWSGRVIEADYQRELQPTQFMVEMASQSWQEQPSQSPVETQQQLAAYLTSEPTPWLSPSVDRQWLHSLLDNHFSLSPSALQDYLECPARFLFQRVIRLPQSPQPHLALGTAAHAALEFVYRELTTSGNVPPLEQIHRRIDQVLAKLPFAPAELAQLAAEAKSRLTAYYEANQAEFRPALEVEKFLGRTPQIVFEGLSLNGKIDRIDWLEELELTVRVVDYKDTKPKSRNAMLGKTQAPLNYFRQLVFYALLVELDSGIPYKVREGEIIFLQPKASGQYTTETFLILPEHLDELKTTLRTVKAELDELVFLDRPPCGECDVCKNLGLMKER